MIEANKDKADSLVLPTQRRAYVTPETKRVELALDETLSSGCKLGSDSVCVGPPITAYEAGS